MIYTFCILFSYCRYNRFISYGAISDNPLPRDPPPATVGNSALCGLDIRVLEGIFTSIFFYESHVRASAAFLIVQTAIWALLLLLPVSIHADTNADNQLSSLLIDILL